MNKDSVQGVVFLAVIILITASVIPIVGSVIGSVLSYQEQITTIEQFNKGTFTNTTTATVNGEEVITLQDGELSGSYQSKTYNFGEVIDLELTVFGTMLNETNASISVTIETSKNGFDTVENSKTYDLSNAGTQDDSIEWEAKNVRFNASFQRDNLTVEKTDLVSVGWGGKRINYLLSAMLTIFVVGFIFYVYQIIEKF